MKEHLYEHRKYVIGGIALVVVLTYITRLLFLQVINDEYKSRADSNAFLKMVVFPARGSIYDRQGELLVYNQPSFDIMVVMREMRDLDTLDLCHSLGISREDFDLRMALIKDRRKNPGYSAYTQQVFKSQMTATESSAFQEKLFRFPGFYVRERAIRRYATTHAAHILGEVAEVSQGDIDRDDYYNPGDYIGKQGVERSYEEELRGDKGLQVLLRDARGRIQGRYKNGDLDLTPVPGKDLDLSIDIKLQALGERLMEGKMGAIVAIEPATGEILCLVSSPGYDPRLMEGKQRGSLIASMQRDPMKPMLNRAISGTYPPGSTFKTSQALTLLQERVIQPTTMYPCNHGFHFAGMKVGCHGHGSPLPLIPAIATSCNGYFCWGVMRMLGDRQKYPTIQDAITVWKDYMVSMGFGYKLGVDLPGEARGMIPNADYYDRHLGKWSSLSVISISIGQGEVTLTPIQIANLCATIANRGHYITPHIVRRIDGKALPDSVLRTHSTLVERTHYETVVEGMRQAVTGGTCRGANTSMYEVCGKTGTAQNRGHDHSVFMGFAPRENPKIAIAVYVENGGFGATYGVPIGALMMEQYINGELSEQSEQKAASFQNRHINYGTRER